MAARIRKIKNLLEALSPGCIYKGIQICSKLLENGFEIINIFNFWQNLRWQSKFIKLVFQKHYIQGVYCPIVLNLPEITLSVMVFETINIFDFR